MRFMPQRCQAGLPGDAILRLPVQEWPGTNTWQRVVSAILRPDAQCRTVTLMQTGEQFRNDLRIEGARPDGNATGMGRSRGPLLSADELHALTALSAFRSAMAVAQTLLIVMMALGAAIAWPVFWVLVPAVLIIATQQHAMFVLAHEAAHYRLFPNRSVNDLAGRLLGAFAGLSMCAYRVVHRLHHNDLYGERDPDIALHGGYPRGKAYLVRKLFADVLGLTAWKTYSYFLGAPAANAETGQAQRPLDDTSVSLRQAARADRWLVAAVQLALPICAGLLFGWYGLMLYLLLWVLPAVTVLQAILRLRAICEHGAPAATDSPLRAARTTLAGPLLRLILFPHHVNYHVEHHLYPAVPHYRLPQLHRTLGARGILANADVRSFGETWARVYAAPAGS